MCPKLIERLSWNGPTVHVCSFMLARTSTKTFVSRIHIRQPSPKNSEKIFVSRKIRQQGHSLAKVSLYSRPGEQAHWFYPSLAQRQECCRSCGHPSGGLEFFPGSIYRGEILRSVCPIHYSLRSQDSRGRELWELFGECWAFVAMAVRGGMMKTVWSHLSCD